MPYLLAHASLCACCVRALIVVLAHDVADWQGCNHWKLKALKVLSVVATFMVTALLVRHIMNLYTVACCDVKYDAV
jgi:hypothetical protein